MSDTILVTGASGQLGSDLVAMLGDRYRVVGCDIDDFDITDPGAVMRAIRDIRPVVVLHTAAFTDVDRCESEPDRALLVNGHAAGFLAEACREVDAYMVYYSTDYVFSGAKMTPYIESDTPDPKTVYGRTKLEGERRAAEILDYHCILRLAWVYGYHGRNFVRTMIQLGRDQMRAAQRGERIPPLRVVNDQIGNPTWTADIVRQTRVLLEERVHGLYHCTSEGETSWFGLARQVFSRLDMPVEATPCTTDQFPRPAPRPAYSSLENAALNAIGCNVMRDWREALDEFLTARKEALLYAV